MKKKRALEPGKKNRCRISEATVSTIHRLWLWMVLQLKTAQPGYRLEEDWRKLKLLCNRHTNTTEQAKHARP